MIQVMRNSFYIFILFCGSLLLLPYGVRGEKIQVCVSVAPHADMVETVGGESVQVHVLQERADSCGVFEPKPGSVKILAESDVYFRTGSSFESVFLPRWRERFSGLQIVDLRKGLDLLPWNPEREDSGHGDHAHEHEDVEWDPHIWLDPAMVRKQAERIYVTLQPLVSEEDAAILKRGYQRLLEKCDELDDSLQNHFSGIKGDTVLVFHPSLGYLGRAYGFKQLAIEKGGHAPGPRALNAIIKEAQDLGMETLFVQPGGHSEEAKVVAKAIGANLEAIDPLGVPWFESMEALAEDLARALDR